LLRRCSEELRLTLPSISEKLVVTSRYAQRVTKQVSELSFFCEHKHGEEYFGQPRGTRRVFRVYLGQDSMHPRRKWKGGFAIVKMRKGLGKDQLQIIHLFNL
jgi:hypothetical protein